ncbi:MAG: hypothetical protein RLN60_03540 [Phycisphaerales bacterium]
MEPISIATAAVTLLTPFVKDSAEAFAEETGKAVYEKTRGLWNRVVSAFKDDPVASDAATRFTYNPATYSSLLIDLLQERLAIDSQLCDEFQATVSEIKEAGPELVVVQKMIEVEGVTGIDADEMTSGEARVEQDIAKAKNVIGARIKKIG